MGRRLSFETISDKDGKVTFRVAEQTHRGSDFAFDAEGRKSNSWTDPKTGVTLLSMTLPTSSEMGTASRLFVRGGDRAHDRDRLTVTSADFIRICSAADAYNRCDGVVLKPKPAAAEKIRRLRVEIKAVEGDDVSFVFADTDRMIRCDDFTTEGHAWHLGGGLPQLASCSTPEIDKSCPDGTIFVPGNDRDKDGTVLKLSRARFRLLEITLNAYNICQGDKSKWNAMPERKLTFGPGTSATKGEVSFSIAAQTHRNDDFAIATGGGRTENFRASTADNGLTLCSRGYPAYDTCSGPNHIFVRGRVADRDTYQIKDVPRALYDAAVETVAMYNLCRGDMRLLPTRLAEFEGSYKEAAPQPKMEAEENPPVPVELPAALEVIEPIAPVKVRSDADEYADILKLLSG